MSNDKDDLRNLELGTSAENERVDDVEVEDEPDGLPPKENVVPNNEETDADAFDDDKLYQPAVTGGKMVYDEDEEKNKRRQKLAIVAIVLILIFAMLLALGIVFTKGNESNKQGLIVITSAPTSQSVLTSAPTPLPTDGTKSPSKAPTTRPPSTSGNTMSPTAAPFAPTFGGPRPVSRDPCDVIAQNEEVLAGNFGEHNFEIYTLDKGVQICGDTYAGFDSTKPNRNLWQSTIGRRNCEQHTFHEGTNICEGVGARRCTADELAQHAGQGSGCGGDIDMLYTSTTCVVGGQSGYLKINIDFRERGMPFFECELNFNTVKTISRCCGDIFE